MRSALRVTGDQRKGWKFFPGKAALGELDVSEEIVEPGAVEKKRSDICCGKQGILSFQESKGLFTAHVSRQWGPGGWGWNIFYPSLLEPACVRIWAGVKVRGIQMA